MSGIFITFEGLDGSGKTTQLRLLVSELRSRGFDVISTCEPGGTLLGKRLREILLDDELSPAPLAELLMFAADRAQHVETLIRPALAKKQIVISDRYADATAAYQGAGRKFAPEIIEQVIRLATDGLKPDLTLFFDLTVEDSLARTSRRTDDGEAQNRLDKETADFHARVRAGYLKIAEKEPARFRILAAKGSINEISARVLAQVLDFIESREEKSVDD